MHEVNDMELLLNLMHRVSMVFFKQALRLVFYSAKDNVVDYQRLTKTTNGLGTTFPPSWVLGSFLLP